MTTESFSQRTSLRDSLAFAKPATSSHEILGFSLTIAPLIALSTFSLSFPFDPPDFNIKYKINKMNLLAKFTLTISYIL